MQKTPSIQYKNHTKYFLYPLKNCLLLCLSVSLSCSSLINLCLSSLHRGRLYTRPNLGKTEKINPKTHDIQIPPKLHNRRRDNQDHNTTTNASHAASVSVNCIIIKGEFSPSSVHPELCSRRHYLSLGFRVAITNTLPIRRYTCAPITTKRRTWRQRYTA